jgi:hypothetical protein
MHDNYIYYVHLLAVHLSMYYLKHEQQSFIRYKDTRRSGVSLGLIKHTSHCECFKLLIQKRSSKFIGEVIFKK